MGSPRNYSRNRRGASPDWDRGVKNDRNAKRAPPSRREIRKERPAEYRNADRYRSEAPRSNGRLPDKHPYEGQRHLTKSNNDDPKGTERWGHSGYKELYENGSSSIRGRRTRSRSRSPVRRSRSRSRGRRTLQKPAEQTTNSRSTLNPAKSRSQQDEKCSSPGLRENHRGTRLKRIPSPDQNSRVVHKSPNKSARMSLSPRPRRTVGNNSNRSHKSPSSSRSPSTSSDSRSSSSSSDYSSSSSHRGTSRKFSSGSSASESEGDNDESREVHEEGEEEEEGEMKDEPPKAGGSGIRMSLSERFGKLAQFSSQRRNFEMVQLRIVASAGNEAKNVSIDEQSPAPLIGKKPELPKPESPPPEMGRWKDFRVDAWQEFHDYHHRDLPNDWEDIRVRHKYYTERGHFARDMSLEELARWEDWWRRYQQWRKGYERAWQSLHGRGVPVEYPDWNSYRNTTPKEPQLGSVRSRLGWRNCDSNPAPRRKKF